MKRILGVMVLGVLAMPSYGQENLAKDCPEGNIQTGFFSNSRHGYKICKGSKRVSWHNPRNGWTAFVPIKNGVIEFPNGNKEPLSNLK